MGRILKKTCSALICLMLMLLIISDSAKAGTYINTYYTSNETEEISSGVTHISGKKLTSRGIVNVEIIKVDLNNDDLKFENVFNSDSMGKKTTVNNLVKNKEDVVAAVNGDFFEMSLSPSFELGITVNDGEIQKLSSGEYYNCYSNSLAAFFLDDNANPYIDFITSNIVFSNDKDTLYVSYYNKAGDKEGTVCLTGKYFTTSASMDSRNPNTYKIVVEDDEIISIVEPGETIDIMENQYVIFLPVNFDRIQNFEVGDEVDLDISLNISNNIDMAIGGAGMFLQNGQVVANGYLISGTTARSFIGFDSGKRYLYFGTVGGLTSTNSGVTSNQLGEILLDYGVSTAMHLDGGGSSTLVTKSSYDEKLTQANDVRSQRAIINAFVVTNDARVGKLAGIKLNLSSNKAVVNAVLPFELCGYDENHKSLTNFDYDDLEIEGDKDITVDYRKGTIKFNEKGRTNLTISCDGFETEMYVDVYGMLTEIQILPDPITIEENGECDLKIVAFTGEKYKLPIDPDSCDYEISPSNLAKVEDGKVIGLNKGIGTICVSYDGLKAYSVLAVGTDEKTIETFNTLDMEAISYPDIAKAEISNSKGKLKIEYEFEESDETQAAYAKYKENLQIPAGASKLILDLTGDAKECMFKVKLVDSANATYTLTASSEIDFKTTQECVMELPTGYTGNLYIERYYVVSLGTDDDIDSSVTIDNVRCLIPADYSKVKCPASVKRTATSTNSEITEIEDGDLIFFNNASKGSMLANYVDNKVAGTLDLVEDENLIVARNTDRVKGTLAYGSLSQYSYDDTLVISMSCIGGSAFDKDPYQYSQLEGILKSAKANNIIITLDGDLNSSALAKDKAMLDYILNKYYETRRVNLYVVMFAGTQSADTMDNGIRYIRLASTLSNVYASNVLIMRKNKDDLDELDYNMITYGQFLTKTIAE